MSRERKGGYRLEILDLDELYAEDLRTENGFRIDTSIDYEKAIKTDAVFELPSIFSDKFDIPRNASTAKYLYKCRCGHLHGNDYIGVVCDRCGTEVKRQTFEVDYRGWIVLPPDIFMINPTAFTNLCKSIKVKDLRGADRDASTGNYPSFSNMSEEDKAKYALVIDKSSDIKITDPEFSRLTFSELIQKDDLFKKFVRKNTRANRVGLSEMILDSPYKTFAIPVISTKFRNISIERGVGGIPIISSKSMGAGGLNSKYKHLSEFVNDLRVKCRRGASNKVINKKLSQIQLLLSRVDGVRNVDANERYKDVWSIIMDKLGKGKDSIIRGQIYGRRYSNVARSILEPLVGHNIDEGIIHIDAFRSMYEEKVKPWLRENYPDIPLPIINRMFNFNHKLSQVESKILLDAFEKLKPFYMLINRPPSIYYSSILGIKVIEVSLTDEVLQTSPFVCQLMAADHDGDELSQFAEYNERVFNALKPQNYILDYKGNYNHGVGPVDILAPLLYKMTEGNKPIITMKNEGE